MPSNVFVRWWLFFLLSSFFHLQTLERISNFGLNSTMIPSVFDEEFPLVFDSVIIRICQRTKNKVRRLSAERLAALTQVLDQHKTSSCKVRELRAEASAKKTTGHEVLLQQGAKSLEPEAEFLSTTLKMVSRQFLRTESFLQQKLTEETAKMEQERKDHSEEVTTLKTQLEKNRILSQEKEMALLQKLSQEEVLRHELEVKLEELNAEKEETQKAHEAEVTEIQDSLNHLKDTEKMLYAVKMENDELKNTCKTFQSEATNMAEEILMMKAKMEQEWNDYHIEIETLQDKTKKMTALKSQLEKNRILSQEKETALLQKLSQEEVLRHELEVKLEELNAENEETQKAHEAEIQDSLNHLKDTEKMLNAVKMKNDELKNNCKTFQSEATSMAEEILGIKAKMEQERNDHHIEIETLQDKMNKMTAVMQEMETNLLHKLAEEEAKTARANKKSVEFKEDLLRVTKERQQFLKNEIKHHQRRAQDNLMAYRDAEQQLTWEQRKSADLQRRLNELNQKLARCNRTHSRGKDGSTQSGYPETERLAMNHHRRQQHERQPPLRAHRGHQRHSY